MLQIRQGHIRRMLCRSSHDRHHQRVLQFAAPLIYEESSLFGVCERFWRIVALGDVGKQGFVAFLELCGTCLVAMLVIRLCVLCQHQGASVNAEGTVEQEARCWWSWLRCICYLTFPSKLFFSLLLALQGCFIAFLSHYSVLVVSFSVKQVYWWHSFFFCFFHYHPFSRLSPAAWS